ncbi:MAG: bifunctional glutamine synthetase adenylyltransferase/deadenyltransferase [Candidatus Dactylopiibacterium carminicum]|uniref:Bifunctional glutamine synthetase adenylyltransferase/adenylyl-removing enzyme n=1 Tax=Candidatus Dactylopiibacterium carminicum TaxID=857335 RepID=A0A272ETM3_9RHOO|nr:bifunctional [glutamate--ammonia ligase]-adenylyl-L-tyrosine phosphorylase/[glutamate--ammonia-ligase] adenylyltransferase [Candidatus Dactylopiibacterium carminicum]KAF7599389.1 bifunctional [glutamate--ammonia ligase]-adenylyl-L-tyrosine phosphorylase/[glutamate--ammonia-ligase] adenylyltransferase [Candidatus Dactylopiibacterium carminicum]PAS93453.1 MAG: bifunctional glutamine synthetase adenylyltransferase/deadenyltransferase [Candidatus Dactylopiibacterium carminicum]PAS95972.1 MAG: bif
MTAADLIAQAAAYSRHFNRLCQARPWLAERLAPTLDRALTREDLQAFLAETALDEQTLGPRLRQLKSWAASHAMVRDLAGLAPLGEVTTTMTLIAEEAIRTAQALLHTQLATRYGQPRGADGTAQALIVLGMGKLGGGELNVSSDIDLIFAYPEDGDTDGARSISNFDFFTRLGRQLIGAISEHTAEGYVFRVDMRLRPNGDSGPLVASFDMLENYFVTQGREWERYAWIKARPLTGEKHAELKNIARPFIFRKYLDFGAIDAMRSLHAQIRREVARRDMADNVKLGPGGIREIEFIAQVFQLIRGGGDRGLQLRPTLVVLKALAERGQISPDTVDLLNAAYDFLRRLEHRIQYLDDAQTHDIPENPADREALAHAMGYADYAALAVDLATHRQLVSKHFSEVFGEHANDDHPLEPLWRAASEQRLEPASLAELGYRDAEESCTRLTAFTQGARLRSMGTQTRQRLDTIMPQVLEHAAARPNPDDTLARMIALIEGIGRRPAYLALLMEYPKSLARVIELLSASSWAATYLTRHPLLLDELLDNRLLATEHDWPAFARELAATMDGLNGDVERQMDVMREQHHAQVFRLLNQDLAGLLTVEHLSDHLSALADVILEETLRLNWQRARRHAPEHRFAILGYGKLGGKELGYASDLDLVFIHDDPDPECQTVYARLGARINSWLDSHTAAGHLFETDTRLRPNGESGLMVTSLAAFEQYQRENAWVWEHQALTRARFCAGNREVGEKFEALRDQLLRLPRDPNKLRADVLAMRHKMRDAFANKGPGFELKHDAGGLIDVEFIVQYLVLAHARQHPELCANKGNIALLGMAAQAGLIPADLAKQSADSYRALRHAQHGLRLNQQKSRVPDDSLDAWRIPVRALWQQVFGED